MILSLCLPLFVQVILTCPAASEGTSLYVLNERFVIVREGAEFLQVPLAVPPLPPRCRRSIVVVVVHDDEDEDAKNDRIAEATEARDASAVAAGAFSAAFRVDCCRSGRSCGSFGWCEKGRGKVRKSLAWDRFGVDAPLLSPSLLLFHLASILTWPAAAIAAAASPRWCNMSGGEEKTDGEKRGETNEKGCSLFFFFLFFPSSKRK